ncbi:hypothetical protein [Streptococcus suis]|uniref:hypothetical protein n=1 Tax=Streptococcus suis TaxID=1307 RepID=UPI00137AFD01|nr:hypothetical protein [Streptococcus suis]
MAKFVATTNLWFEKDDKTVLAGELVELTKSRVDEINSHFGEVVLEPVKTEKKEKPEV